jgi:hypothetical protein
MSQPEPCSGCPQNGSGCPAPDYIKFLKCMIRLTVSDLIIFQKYWFVENNNYCFNNGQSRRLECQNTMQGPGHILYENAQSLFIQRRPVGGCRWIICLLVPCCRAMECVTWPSSDIGSKLYFAVLVVIDSSKGEHVCWNAGQLLQYYYGINIKIWEPTQHE